MSKIEQVLGLAVAKGWFVDYLIERTMQERGDIETPHFETMDYKQRCEWDIAFTTQMIRFYEEIVQYLNVQLENIDGQASDSESST
jgi:hypothetical protein